MNSTSLYSLQQGIARTIVGGRLERESDTELRWNAYENYSIGLYNGESWEIVTPSGVVQVFNDSTTISGAALTYDTNYDVYAKYVSPENFTLEFQEWAGDTSRYEDPVRWQGIYVRDLTDEGKKKRWLGVVRLKNDGGVLFTDNNNKRFIANVYNKQRKMIKTHNNTNGSWSYTGTSWREFNGGTNHVRAEFLCLGPISAQAVAMVQNNATNRANVTFGLDSTSSATGLTSYSLLNLEKLCLVSYIDIDTAGYHYVTLLESSHTGAQITLSWADHNGGVFEVDV